MDHVVLDIEIQKTIEETKGGWDATDQLGVACAVVYESRDDRFRVYGPDDVLALQERLLKADRITGYNIWRFDLPVIWGIRRDVWEGPIQEGGLPTILLDALRLSTDDLLARIWEALGLDASTFSDAHRGWSLETVARGTLGRGKTGYGGDAPKWYQAGKWSWVVDYCLSDVALERDLCQFIDRHGFVVNKDRVVRIKRWKGLD